jgi:mRNA interferase MazF
MLLTQEIIERFKNWTKLKIRIHVSEREISFKEGQVWWASLGQNIGVEANGKNTDFERPIVIVKKFNEESFIGVPLSSKEKVGRYYLKLKDIQGKSSIVNLSQVRIMSSKRLIREIEESISESDLNIIKSAIKEYL